MEQSNNPGCLFAIFKLLGLTGGRSGTLPYRLRDDFLSPAELAFYHALAAAVGNRMQIVFKVNLGDLFFVVDIKKNYAYRGRIAQKHVDFLLCEPQTLKPMAGIELDDASHHRQDRRNRDALVDQVFKTAGLPLIRMPCRRDYDATAIRAVLAPIMDAEATPPPAPQANPASEPVLAVSTAPAVPSAPLCPKCGIPLVQRESAHGKFYGCPNFPKCRQTAKVEQGG